MANYECEKYICTQDTLKQTLDTYGVAIIPSILSMAECNNMIEGVWSYLSHITQTWPVPISRCNPASWREIHELHLLRGAMFQQYSNGHSQYMWDLRQNPLIVEIFARFWGVSADDLLASFDGSNFTIPNNLNTLHGKLKHNKHKKGNTEAGTETAAPWYHLDQSLTRPEFETVQSWVSAYDVRDGDATLAFLESSHLHFAELGDSTASKSVADWKVLSDNELEFYKSCGCMEKRIACPAGSLVMWDSRTVHYGAPSLKKPHEQSFRLVGYVCYRPRYFIRSDMLCAKRDAFNSLDTTSHHPTNVRVFRKLPQKVALKYPVNLIEPPVLTDLGRRLAGF